MGRFKMVIGDIFHRVTVSRTTRRVTDAFACKFTIDWDVKPLLGDFFTYNVATRLRNVAGM